MEICNLKFNLLIVIVKGKHLVSLLSAATCLIMIPLIVIDGTLMVSIIIHQLLFISNLPVKVSNVVSCKSYWLLDIEISLPGGQSITKSTIGWIVVSCDAAISILFLLFLMRWFLPFPFKLIAYRLKKLEVQTVINVLGNNEGIDGYSIEVRSLPTHLTMAELKAKLWTHFSSVHWQLF